VVDDLMVACLFIDIDGDATKGSHFGGEVVKKRVVLSDGGSCQSPESPKTVSFIPLPFICLRHFARLEGKLRELLYLQMSCLLAVCRAIVVVVGTMTDS
jgi:hypothetical protein